MGRRADHSDAPEGDARRRAQAMAAPTRRAVLDLLTTAPTALTAQELAAALGVHPTAVRQHMAVLLDVGLAEQVALPPQGRGRPRVAYRALGEPDAYRWLAAALATGVDEGIGPREIGRRIGASHAVGGVEDLAAALVGEAQRIGFRPELRRDGPMIDIVLAECPFADVATASPQVVCELHRGIAEGIASGADGPVEVLLRPAPPAAGGCHLTATRSPAV